MVRSEPILWVASVPRWALRGPLVEAGQAVAGQAVPTGYRWASLPRYRWTIQPRYRWAIQPRYRWAIQPRYRWAIQPRYRWAIQPRYRWAIQPRYRWAIRCCCRRLKATRRLLQVGAPPSPSKAAGE